ncbi:MAG TPA: ABC transporter substrate-binding protein [Nocardioidaceae bacterium]|nr:ABC transporter substrate-binding protein [Nocardioidaceae bacterium]
MKRISLLLPRSVAVTAALAATLTLAACGGDDPLSTDTGNGDGGDGTTIHVGSANFPESVVLAEVYAKALEDAGFTVEKTLNIGSREAYLKAMTDTAELDVFPEYTGNLRLYFDEDATASAPDEVYDELVAALPDTLTVLEMAPAEDKDAVVVTQETAAEYSLTSIADLKDVAGDLVLGGPPEWKTRSTGLPGLESVYGVVFKDFRELDAGGPLTLRALRNGQIDAGNIFSTDPTVASGELVALEDPEALYASQNIVPLVRTEVLDDALEEALNAVSAALTQEELLALVNAVVADKEDPEDVAADWVDENV